MAQLSCNLEAIISDFDQKKQGNISNEDLNEWCNRNNVELSNAGLLMKRYDKNDDGKLNYNEISKIFLP